MQKHCFLVLSMLACLGAHATNYYIDSAKGNNGYNGQSATRAFKTIQKAANLTNAGDTVFIMNGSYTYFSITRSGSAAAQIVYTNFPGHKPKLVSDSIAYGVITIKQGTNYITINGLEVIGYGVKLSLAADTAAAKAAPVCPVAGQPATSVNFISKYNGSGILIGSTDTTQAGCHHIVISNNVVHDCACGGILFGHCDYITVESNIIYNNAWYSPYGVSGIAFNYSYNYDNNLTTYRMIVKNNVSYGNRQYPVSRINCTISDGNGIIIDIPMADYKGKVLVANNICYNNGGSGMHSLSTNHVDFYNNVSYLNNVSPENGGGTLFSYDADSVNFYNNIIVSSPGKSPIGGKRNTHVTYDYNLYYGGKSYTYTDTHGFFQDPGFVNPSIDPAVADFNLKSGSFAINNGSNTHTYPTDKDGIARPIGSIVDIGAYESNYTGGQNTCNIGLQAKIVGNGNGTGTGEGSAGTLFAPFDSKPDSINPQSRKAIIYPDTLFKNIPANAIITSLQFRRAVQVSPTNNSTSTQILPDSTIIRVYLRNEATDNFGAAAFDWTTILSGSANPATLVYEGDAAAFVGNGGGWRTLSFQTPFSYTGKHIGVFIDYVQKKRIAGGKDINWYYDNGGTQAFYNATKYPQMANAFKYAFASGTTIIGNSLTYANERRPVVSFGYCTNYSPLPVNFLSFSGKGKLGKNFLNWVVNQEIDNAGFEVQRSADCENFIAIGYVASEAANGANGNAYEFTDVAPLNGIGYYRLLQKDRDGKTNYSTIVSIANVLQPLGLMSIYPNPVGNKLYAEINIAEPITAAKFTIRDITGRVVGKFERALASGQNKIAIDVYKQGAGTYLLVVELPNGNRATSKFIKNRN
ncbi:choice-of-anchor Q domain-containing protein [Parasediminibacterium sp. JCM 36343]|uniref:choice-of-anchor Q domain-containing protein n=1 Tax=Parasediminibacterium sp. JCM 36343 TaxID=3374279 RepID=UPI00397AED31